MESGSDDRLPTVDEFARRVARASRRLAAMRQPVADRSAPPNIATPAPAPEHVVELETMVEELSVATEELRHQQEEILAAGSQLELERIRYRELFDFAPDAYLVTDTFGLIREANRAACVMLGVAEKYVDGKPLASFVEASDRRAFRELLAELPGLGYGGERPIRIRPRNGTPLPVGVTVAVSRETGEVRWLLRDISERVEAHERLSAANAQLEHRVAERTEALREALDAERAARARAVEDDKLKARVLGLLSHEIRTPLQTLVGYTELLERELHGPLTKAQRQDVERMQRSHEHMLHVVNSMLEYVRLRHGALELDLVPVPVGETIVAVANMLHPQIEERRIVLDLGHIGPESVALADPERLRQVVINLLANAIKFSEPGGRVQVDVDLREREVAIFIADHGCGIPEDRLGSIFEPFVQLGHRRGGSGLGLSISRDMVAAMGGTLGVESRLGEGSVFTIVLRR